MSSSLDSCRPWLIAALVCGAAAAHASLLGDTVSLSHRYPTADTPYRDYGSQSVTAEGAHFLGMDEHYAIAVYADRLDIDYLHSVDWTEGAFNGISFANLSGDIGPVTLLQAAAGFTASRILQGRRGFTADWAGLTFSQGDRLSFQIATALPTLAPVPEPAAWTLLATGLGLIGWHLRRLGRSRFFLWTPTNQ